MELIELQELVSGDYAELQKKITAEKPAKDVATFNKQYDPKQHDVADNSKRPDKIIQTEQGPSTAPVTRIPISLQKKIVSYAATFLCGNPIKLICNPEPGQQTDLLAMVQKVWDDNKLDYKSKGIAKLCMTECEVAELWYSEPADPTYWVSTPFEGAKARLRVRTLAQKYGDQLYPVFNSAGDMIAFGRGYSIKVGDKLIEHFDLYTDTTIYFAEKGEQAMAVTKTESNLMGKIPVIYYSQELPEWADVQESIDRLETVQSNLGDTNDYFGSPLVLAKGKIKGFSKKGEQGKVLQCEDGADASYLTWDQSPESTKLEMDTLRAFIHENTSTPDINFEKVKGLGNFSGVALKMLFLPAHMKASEHEETFGECIQRRINFIKAALTKINLSYAAVVNLSIKPGFEYYLPKNDVEKVDTLVAAVSGGILSKRTAVGQNPLVQNPEAEMDNLIAEANEADPTIQ